MTPDVDKHFAGAREHWRASYDEIVASTQEFGAEGMTEVPAVAYIGLTRNDKQFAIVKVTKGRMDVGIKLNGVAPEGRFRPSGKWNELVTHRVQVTDPAQIDAELTSWLKRAYAAALTPS